VQVRECASVQMYDLSGILNVGEDKKRLKSAKTSCNKEADKISRYLMRSDKVISAASAVRIASGKWYLTRLPGRPSSDQSKHNTN
jgi:hypothetical protein